MVSANDVVDSVRSYQAKPLISPWLVAGSLVCLEILVLAGSSAIAGHGYYLVYYGQPFADPLSYLQAGALIGLFYVLYRALTGQYRPSPNDAYGKAIGASFLSWNVAMATFLLVAFLTKTSSEVSRGFTITFYVFGFAAAAAVRVAFIAVARRGFHSGWLVEHRVLVVGLDSEVASFEHHYRPSSSGMRVADIVLLPSAMERDDALSTAVASAVETARKFDVEDVLLLLPWSQRKVIDQLATAFLAVPASIHLGPEHDLERFGDIAISRLANAPCLRLTRAPLDRIKRLAKRLFDIVVALIALVLLAPFLLLVGLLVRLDSPGPALFFQRRLGFNNRVFRIAKFRTTTTMEEDMTSQAVENESRVTRFGRFLRRWNIDEMPQILNVLAGSMSIVGPRPHALKMDDEYQQKIALYARRHNVKPGITGWAQINGLRGLTDDPGKMEAGVAHDLFYIENWSPWFDLYIVLMTLVSPSAYRNAG